MITYNTAYMKLYILGMITYYSFSDRPIFLTRGFQSEYSCLINHNIFVLYKIRYKKPNPNSYSFYYRELQ